MRNRCLRNILVGFSTLVVGLMAIPLLAYLTVGRQPGIEVRPLKLVKTGENGGYRCPKGRWDSPSEHPVCYMLQEKLADASWDGNVAGVAESLQKGAHIEGSFYQSDSALDTAAMSGQPEAVKLLIENGANVNSFNSWRTSPLQTAVIYDRFDIAKTLLENGANVCHSAFWDDLSTPTALDIAVGKRNFEMIKLLTAYGAPFCRAQYTE